MITAATFATVLQEHRSMLLGIAREYVPAHDAEDVLQVACISCWRARAIFRGDCALHNWLAVAVRNHARKLIQHRHRLRRRPEGAIVPLEFADDNPVDLPAPDPVATTDMPVVDAILAASRAHLAPHLAAILEARDGAGENHEQLAARFGISQGTVKSRLHRARAALARHVLADPRARELLAQAA